MNPFHAISPAMQGGHPHTKTLLARKDIWMLILETLRLPDLLTVARTCRTMCFHALSFLAACEMTNCLMTGSCSRAMLTGDTAHPCRDLNLVCAQDGFEIMHTFLVESFQFVQISDQRHPALRYAVGECRQYAKGESLITMSTPKPGMHVLHVILSAPSTADMVFMNGGGLACFYSRWCKEGLSVVTHTGRQSLWSRQIGCAGNSNHGLRLHQDTDFLRRPCGKLCPTLWHHVESSPHLLALDWSPHSSIKNVSNDADVEWRLNSYCLNSACPHNLTVMAANYECAGSQTDLDVRHVSTQLACRQPTYLHVFQGIFYGARSTQPFLVPVPVRDGAPTCPSLDDLDVNYWVKQYSLGVYTTARRCLQCTFDHVPHIPGVLDGLYTLFFERPAAATQRNRLIRKMARLNGCTEVIKGSLLVMKEGPRGLMDLMHNDIDHANLLINSLLYYSCLPRATTP
ncbi:uncharacterized protein HD556DRAFT_1445199 [Suillus plorans]|uniref:Uncharacterized protein n=1 Tax=Suillus plorans TaxID=116603 RepID=A0A9P7DG65_9AGAM|nr:uncharacterized protein HD556DRAFT_1445199 [Suillus plorans]KAG1791566.1 hypothetical protein HD556DRAFT_1445199 [Suillus plorans]